MKTKTKTKYRKLRVGEIIREGDQFQSANCKWHYTTLPGSAVDGCHYRRPVKARKG